MNQVQIEPAALIVLNQSLEYFQFMLLPVMCILYHLLLLLLYYFFYLFTDRTYGKKNSIILGVENIGLESTVYFLSPISLFGASVEKGGFYL